MNIGDVRLALFAVIFDTMFEALKHLRINSGLILNKYVNGFKKLFISDLERSNVPFTVFVKIRHSEFICLVVIDDFYIAAVVFPND